MKTVFRILGVVFIAAAAVIGYFFNFPGDVVVTVALAAFGVTSEVVTSVSDAKTKGTPSWLAYVLSGLSIAGGVACAVGGIASSLITTIAGGALAVLAFVIAYVLDKKTAETSADTSASSAT